MSKLIQEKSLREHSLRIDKAIDFIRLNLDQEISLDKLARVSNFSKFHFHRIFKAITGLTPYAYIVRSRLERAKFKLLQNPAKSISEIACSVGFASVSSFSKSFKRENKIGPTEWREFKLKENSRIGP